MKRALAVLVLAFGVVAALYAVHLAQRQPGAVVAAVERASPPVVASRAQARRDRYHWYELTDAQDTALRTALAGLALDKPVLVLSATADSLGLAEDITDAINDVKGSGAATSDRPMDVVDGLHCTHAPLCELIEKSTSIQSVVDPEEPDAYVLNFGRKR